MFTLLEKDRAYIIDKLLPDNPIDPRFGFLVGYQNEDGIVVDDLIIPEQEVILLFPRSKEKDLVATVEDIKREQKEIAAIAFYTGIASLTDTIGINMLRSRLRTSNYEMPSYMLMVDRQQNFLIMQ